ncbi:MAG TPA: DUF4215 domain-containing protein [Polyangiales bacterium]
MAGTCTLETCGDGFVTNNELCDDGNESNDDECSVKCIPTSCGNSMLDTDEDCDDGNQEDGDGCPATCRGPVCGDGKIEGDEQCEWSQVAMSGVEESFGCTTNCQKDYACEECQRANCADYALNATSKVDAVTNCLGQVPADAGASETDASDVASPEAGVADAGSTDTGGTEASRCVAVVNCALKNGCGFDTSAGESPVLACFCGENASDACQAQGPASNGVCRDEVEAAVGSDAGAAVIARVTDTTSPLGRANALLACYRDHCAAECAPRTSPPDTGMQPDAGTELDADVPSDADVSSDADAPFDSDVRFDADVQVDAGTPPDAGTQLDVESLPDA